MTVKFFPIPLPLRNYFSISSAGNRITPIHINLVVKLYFAILSTLLRKCDPSPETKYAKPSHVLSLG